MRAEAEGEGEERKRTGVNNVVFAFGGNSPAAAYPLHHFNLPVVFKLLPLNHVPSLAMVTVV